MLLFLSALLLKINLCLNKFSSPQPWARGRETAGNTPPKPTTSSPGSYFWLSVLLWCLSAQAILAAEYADTHYIPLIRRQETHFGNKVTCFDHSILKAADEHILLFSVLAGEGRAHQFPPCHLLGSCTPLFLSSWLASALTHTQSSLSNLFSILLQLWGV